MKEVLGSSASVCHQTGQILKRRPWSLMNRTENRGKTQRTPGSEGLHLGTMME